MIFESLLSTGVGLTGGGSPALPTLHLLIGGEHEAALPLVPVAGHTALSGLGQGNIHI